MKLKRIAAYAALPAAILTMQLSAFGATSSTDKLPELTQSPTVYAAQTGDCEQTKVTAYYENSDEILNIFRDVRSSESDYAYTAKLFGVKEYGASELACFVQIAYSLDSGKSWVNDTDLTKKNFDSWTSGEYEISDDLYVNLPCEQILPDSISGSMEIMDLGFQVAGSAKNKEAADMAAFLTQNTGKRVAENNDYAEYYTIDLTGGSLYMKARYVLAVRVYGESGTTLYRSFSPWSKAFKYDASFNPGSAGWTTGSYMKYAVPTLENIYDNGEHRVAVIPSAKLKTLISQSEYARKNGYSEMLYGGRYRGGKVCIEVKVGKGDWFFLESIDANKSLFNIYDSAGIVSRLKSENHITVASGDAVYIRARYVLGDSIDSYFNIADNKYHVEPAETAVAYTGYSGDVRINVSGNYTIEYDLNGGSFKDVSKIVESYTASDSFVIDLTSKAYIPTKDGCTFDGWYTSASFSSKSKITAIDTSKNKFLQLYAKWNTPTVYSVKYELGYPQASYSGITEYTKLTKEGLELGKPVLTGAVFKGWYTDKEYSGSPVTAIDPSQEKNLTFYAKWKFTTYKVTYSLNKGTNAADNPETFTVVPGKQYYATLKKPSRANYTFDGWYYDSSFKDGLLSNETGTRYYIDKAANVTVYAKWVAGKGTITYINMVDGKENSGLGVYNPNPASYEYGKAVVLENLSLGGYKFGGWFSDKALTKKAKGIAATDTGAKTFYAKWTEQTFKVEYVLNADKDNSPAASTITNKNASSKRGGSALELKAPVTTDKFFAFEGWYTNSDLAGNPVTVWRTNAPVTLYAKWTELSRDMPYKDVAEALIKNGGKKPYYYDHLQFLYERDIMTGFTADTFGLGEMLTRQQAAVILYRYAGSPSVTSSGAPFPDVKDPKHWAYKAIVWSKSTGVITGYSSGDRKGCFGPADNITREQLCVILYRMAGKAGYDTTVSSKTSYKKVSDWDKVSSWAAEAINWGYEKGIIGNGSPFNPKNNITREAAATMLSRYIQLLESR